MVRDAVQKVFNVHVVDVNILTVHGKTRRFGRHESQLPDWKKAVVTLAQGERISFFEGV
jgi:large subunit ribosomal protein L23